MSGITSLQARPSIRLPLAGLLALLVVLMAIGPAIARFEPMGASHGSASAADRVGHLVVSELVTGGASASDEFIEIYNPTMDPLPLENLELVYVTASGATVTRKAAWSTSGASVPAGGHVLVANAAGLFAPIADATYASGLAATGGSVALRILGATTPIDALGWGNATSTWLEGTPGGAPPAGSSLERLPGGQAGSGQDTNDNATDFVLRNVPDPQNASAEPIATPLPSASPTQTPSASFVPSITPERTDSPAPSASPSVNPTAIPTATLTPTPSPTPTPTPTPTQSASPSPTLNPTVATTPTPAPVDPIPIAEARLLPDGTSAAISGVALTDSAFTDGGGCLEDPTGGIAVMLSPGEFARGDRVVVSGSIGDRYAQRTLRTSADEMTILGPASDPSPIPISTGSVGEGRECQLVELSASVVSSPTGLSSGIAIDVDDGTGAVRVLVGPGTGIDTSTWVRGAHLVVVGVAGQRDSSGTDVQGYRVMPRDAADILQILPPATPSLTPSATPSATPSSSPTHSPSPSPSHTASPSPKPSASAPPLIDIRQARALATGKLVHVRGVVTLGTGIVDGSTAVIQDASAAIALRLGGKAGAVRRGVLLEVVGVRSTKAGMLTIRVDEPPRVIGSASEPSAHPVMTAGGVENLEARLLVVRGIVTSTPVRSTAGNVAFSVDDGSGPMRVTLFSASRISRTGLVRGADVEVRGVLAQETTGQQPDRGYRLWPRDGGDVRVYAAGLGAGATAAQNGSAGTADGTGVGLGEASIGSEGQPGSGAREAAARVRTDALREPDLGSAGASAAGRAAQSPREQARANSAREPSVELLSAHSVSSRHASVLLLTALALATLFGVLAWRTGVFGRLRILIAGLGDQAIAASPTPPAAEPWKPATGVWGASEGEGGDRMT